MTPLCRLRVIPFILPAICGLFAGCAGPGQFSAGRLPYGADSQITANDPFAGASKKAQVANTADPSKQPAQGTQVAQMTGSKQRSVANDYTAPPGPESRWRREPAAPVAHQTAYADSAAMNPFESTAPPDGSFRSASAVQPMSHSMPASSTESNPFAVVEGRPATASTPPPSDEQFLPPIR